MKVWDFIPYPLLDVIQRLPTGYLLNSWRSWELKDHKMSQEPKEQKEIGLKPTRKKADQRFTNGFVLTVECGSGLGSIVIPDWCMMFAVKSRARKYFW